MSGKDWPLRITITGPGSTFCFESEIIRRALEAEGVHVEVRTNFDCHEDGDGDVEAMMAERRRRMKGDWSGGDPDYKGDYDHLGTVESYVVIIEDHQPWGG
jgi:hypothetical protein